jgi:histidinol-phosphatase (PHP family)
MQDYHMHTYYSADGLMSTIEACDQALKMNLDEIAFTEHVDFDPNDLGYEFLNFEKYTLSIQEAQSKYKNKLDISQGLEIGIQSYFSPEIDTYLADKDVDFVIGSIHMVDHYDLYSGEYFIDRNESDCIKGYIKETTAAVERCRGFDILGHLDLVTRFTKYFEKIEYPDYAKDMETLFKILIKNQIGIEINTSGLRHGEFTNPAPHILRHYFELGGRLLTLGSDAHKVENIAYGFDQMITMALEIGFKDYYIYKKRIPFPMRIKA